MIETARRSAASEGGLRFVRRGPVGRALVVGLALGLLGAAGPLEAAPIGVPTALPVHVGGVLLRSEASFRYAGRGPAPTYAVARRGGLRLTALWSPARRWVLGAEGFAWLGSISVRGAAGGRAERTSAGWGDASLFARFVPWRLDGRRGVLRLAVLAGAILPVGRDDVRDALGLLPPWQQPSMGALVPWAQLVLTRQTAAWQLDVALRGATGLGDARWDPGEEVRLDGSFQLVLATFEEMTEGVPGFLYGVLEGRAGWKGPHQGTLAPFRSGGPFGSVLAGLQLLWEGQGAELAIRLPVVQPFGKHDSWTALGAWRVDL